MIFNRKKIQICRNSTARDNGIVQNPSFTEYAPSIIIENLSQLKQDFSNILNIGCRNGILTEFLLKQYGNAKLTVSDISSEHIKHMSYLQYDKKVVLIHADEEEIDNVLDETNQFDLITFSLGLHSINDVQSFLKNVKKLLAPNGIFIGNFIGGRSFKALRVALMAAETEANYPHSPHIHPFIQFDHLPPLLQGAGFKEVIIDHEVIELEFDSPLALMRAVKNFGESNTLVQASNYAISKTMYSMLRDNFKPFFDEIILINFIASTNKHSIRL